MRVNFISPANIVMQECELIGVSCGQVCVRQLETGREFKFDVSKCHFWPVGGDWDKSGFADSLDFDPIKIPSKNSHEDDLISKIDRIMFSNPWRDTESTKQQPSVPVQFVVASNMNDEDTELLTNALSGEKTFFCGDTYEVEQVGAVLYVRGK